MIENQTQRSFVQQIKGLFTWLYRQKKPLYEEINVLDNTNVYDGFLCGKNYITAHRLEQTKLFIMMENQTQLQQNAIDNSIPKNQSSSTFVKQILCLAAMLVLLAITTENAEAKIWRVNNNGNITADFTTINDAIVSTNVMNGDTIHVEPSSTSYGNIEVDKPLVFLGNGYFLNSNDSTQYRRVTSKIDMITFLAGSDGSVISGIEFTGDYNRDESDIVIKGVNNLIIKNNFLPTHIYFPSSNPSSNIFIQQNVFKLIAFNEDVDNLVISNNIITANDSWFAIARGNQYAVEAQITNNVFQTRVRNISINNSIFRNNIFTSSDDSNILGSNNAIENNICACPNLGLSGDNNLNSIDIQTVFVSPDNQSEDGIWVLRSNSPAIESGFNGVNMGIFGGGSPYILSGIPPIPHIYELTVPTQTSKEAGLTISLKAKSN